MEDKLSPLNTKTNQNERTMKDTHTPGPWHVKNGNSIYASNRYIGLSMSGHLYGNDLPKEANARLMAASTEMYELMPKLVEMLGYMAYILDQSGSYDTSEARSLADEWIDIRTKIEGDE